MTGIPKITVLIHDPEGSSAVPRSRQVRVLHQPDPHILNAARNVFILVSSSELPRVAELVRSTNKRHRLRALFIRDTDPWSLPQMLDRANLRILGNTFVYSKPDVPRRVMAAWQLGAQEQLVAYAKVLGDRLFLVSCAMETFELPFNQLPALKRIPREQRHIFEIADDGSYIYWPESDIHLDVDALRYATDPDWRKRSRVAKLAQNKRFGKAVAAIRKAHGLRQSDISGLSERQVRRIETGERATVRALELLAKVHELSLDDYLNEVARMANKAKRAHRSSFPASET